MVGFGGGMVEIEMAMVEIEMAMVEMKKERALLWVP